MTRIAAILLAGLAATPAAACPSVPEVVSQLRAPLPARAYVGEIPATSLQAVLAWLESEGLPHEADRIIQVAGDRGVGLVLVAPGGVCAGVHGIELVGDKAAELVNLVKRYRALKGFGPELQA